MRITIDVKNEIKSAYIKGERFGEGILFNVAKEMFENEGYRIISLEENAKLRIRSGKNSSVSKYGNWVREGMIYIPKKGIYLTKNSPIMDSPSFAVECYSSRQEFYLTNKQVEKALNNACKIELTRKETRIPTSKFGEDELTVFAFGKQAKAYGELLNEAGFRYLPIMHDCEGDDFRKKTKPLVYPIFFHGLKYFDRENEENCGRIDGGSGFVGMIRADLLSADDQRVRGICYNQNLENKVEGCKQN